MTVADAASRSDVVPNPNPAIKEDILSRRLLALVRIAPPATVAAATTLLLGRYPGNRAAVNVQGRALLDADRAAEADEVTRILRQNPDGGRMEPT